MLLDLPDPQPGDEIEARHFQVIYDALRRLQLSVAEASGLTLDEGAAGTVVGYSGIEGFWVKLTSSSGNAYAWTEQIPQADGTWVDGYRSGTTSDDPAREANGTTTVSSFPRTVWAQRAPASNEVVFQLGVC